MVVDIVEELLETVNAAGIIGVTLLTGLDGESVFDVVTLLKGLTEGSKVFVETFTL